MSAIGRIWLINSSAVVGRGGIQAGWLQFGRAMSSMSELTGRKTRSLEEQLKKLNKKPGGAENDTSSEDSKGKPDDSARQKHSFGQGTMTLAERLSQSLKDPMRAPGFLGSVSKGDVEIECHEVCKVLRVNSRRSIFDADTLSNLVDIVEISDTNWFDKFTILFGNDENFCRGLDIKSLAAMGRAKPGSPADQMPMLKDLYTLGFRIAKSPKTRIAVIDGHCFGEGAPLALCHGNLSPHKAAKNFVIGGQKTVYSFQSAHYLGMSPGCGSSYFLPRLKGHIGFYIALTGVRLNGADCQYAGIATHFMPPDRIGKVTKLLSDWGQLENDHGLPEIQAVLDDFATSPMSMKGPKVFEADASFYTRYSSLNYTDATHLEAMQEPIDRIFSKASVADIAEALKVEDTPWAKATLAALERASPSALAVTMEMLRRGAQSTSVEECMRTEWRVAKRMLEGLDFFEAVRAFEMDKDGKPRWGPAACVGGFFKPMGDAELTPLDLTLKHIVKGHTKFGKGEPRV